VDERVYAEKRLSPRAPIGVIVRVETPDGARHYYSKNLSAGGVFLLAEKPLEAEAHVKLELFLPLMKTPVRTEGEVAWIQRQEPTGFAVRFTAISDSSRELIRWVVARYLGEDRLPPGS
jgi:uncharacterized protein (TIGR02266 family)